MIKQPKPVIEMQKVYGVTISRERGDGQRIDAFMVRSDTLLGAVTKACLHRRHISKIEAVSLGYDKTAEYFDNQFRWLIDAKSAYESAGVNGAIGYYLPSN